MPCFTLFYAILPIFTDFYRFLQNYYTMEALFYQILLQLVSVNRSFRLVFLSRYEMGQATDKKS